MENDDEQWIEELALPEPVDVTKHVTPKEGEGLVLHAYQSRGETFTFETRPVTPLAPLPDLHGEPAVWPIAEEVSPLALGGPVFDGAGRLAGTLTRLGDKTVIVPAARLAEAFDSGFNRAAFVGNRGSIQFSHEMLRFDWGVASIDPRRKLAKSVYTYLVAAELPPE
ncbi:MAG: hypothetical protein GY953_07580, partial [bacterium]|nr:hypothetical protein [bacterium]